MVAYHGSTEFRELIVAAMKAAQEEQRFTRGTFGRENGGSVACMIGVMTGGLFRSMVYRYRYDSVILTSRHAIVARLIGIPEELVILMDDIFELQENDDLAGEFAVNVMESIPAGIIHDTPLVIGVIKRIRALAADLQSAIAEEESLTNFGSMQQKNRCRKELAEVVCEIVKQPQNALVCLDDMMNRWEACGVKFSKIDGQYADLAAE